MKRSKRTAIILTQLTALFFVTCGLTTGERERAILEYYSDTNKDKYADLLVDVSRYTTAGADFHKKYFKHLIGVAGDIVENKKLTVEKGSVGFYFDKRSGDRSKLYLGLDVNTGSSYDKPFETVAASLIMGSLKEVMVTINSCRSVFIEKEIIGMVLGWMWSAAGNRQHMSIWIIKEDLLKFEDGMITFDELIQRSTITNTAGRVIRLPL